MRAVWYIVWVMLWIFFNGCFLAFLYAVEATIVAAAAVIIVPITLMGMLAIGMNWRNQRALDFEGRKRAYQEGHLPQAAAPVVSGGELDTEADQG